MQMPDSFTTTIKIDIKKAGVVVNTHNEAAKSFAKSLIASLETKNISTITNEIVPDLDIIITLGGDGTLLRIAEKAARHAIPIIGVNLGNLGFLTELTENEVETALTKITSERVTVENRMMLKTYIIKRDSNEASDHRYALNDVVINKNTLDRILSLSTKANEEVITTYKADGLIFSSATGSTAYSLSAGGPLVHPGLSSILVTPICPFMLSSRPILLPDNKVITTTFSPDSSNKSARIIIDGQEAWEMNLGDSLIVEKAEHPLQLIASSSIDYFQVLRNKLHWGGKEK